jgi:2-oxoglutarate dehydrogenase E1 component
MAPYRHCHVVWCQEEPRNMGAFSYLEGQLEEIALEVGFEKPRPRYAGRTTSASPAVGLLEQHKREQAQLVEEALTIGLPSVGRLAARRGRKEPGKP